MSMSESLQEAIIAAEKSSDVKELRKTGYFLNSGISILSPSQETLNDWILTYYSPKSQDVVQVFVKDTIEVRKPDKPLAPNMKEIIDDSKIIKHVKHKSRCKINSKSIYLIFKSYELTERMELLHISRFFYCLYYNLFKTESTIARESISRLNW